MADDPQHLGHRHLPLKRLLLLPEQPRVLNRDDRLVRERLEQFDFRRGECSGLVPDDANDADDLPLALERHIELDQFRFAQATVEGR